jgi:hypothetical protein
MVQSFEQSKASRYKNTVQFVDGRPTGPNMLIQSTNDKALG